MEQPLHTGPTGLVGAGCERIEAATINHHRGQLVAIAIAPEWRHLGVGSALLDATTARAREIGLTAINATIRGDNTGGLTFYSRMGFIDHEIVPAVPLKDGTPVDRIRKRFAL